MKERTVALSPRFNERVRALGIQQVASVHDETLFHIPRELMTDQEAIYYMSREMENGVVKHRIPMRVAVGLSNKNWCEASKSAKPLKYTGDMPCI
jgi:DNA polymerase I-like protein with 3'-5' exonuclease and polymerase domains